MHGTGQITKDNWNTESRRLVRGGRRYFVVSPGSIPLNKNKYFSKLGRSLHVTEEAVYTDSSEWSYLVIDTIIQSGTTEIPPLLSSWIARAFFYIF